MAILERLAAQKEEFAEAIEAAAAELLSEVDVEDVAAEVREALELLQPEDVWDRSGRTRDGYVSPSEAAWTVFDEALEPFRAEMRKYQELSLGKEANSYCQGILKGTYDFEKDVLVAIQGLGRRCSCRVLLHRSRGMEGTSQRALAIVQDAAVHREALPESR